MFLQCELEHQEEVISSYRNYCGKLRRNHDFHPIHRVFLLPQHLHHFYSLSAIRFWTVYARKSLVVERGLDLGLSTFLEIQQHFHSPSLAWTQLGILLFVCFRVRDTGTLMQARCLLCCIPKIKSDAYSNAVKVSAFRCHSRTYSFRNPVE